MIKALIGKDLQRYITKDYGEESDNDYQYLQSLLNYNYYCLLVIPVLIYSYESLLESIFFC